MPYLDVSGAWIEPKKSGGILTIEGKTQPALIELKDQTSLDMGLQVGQGIRTLAHSAQITIQEQMAPRGESAFTETGRRTIPSSPGSVSTLALGDLLTMTPSDFEHFTAESLELMGYRNMQVVGGSGNLGADISGYDPQGRTVVVQCKRYAPGNRVGSPAIQQFIGMRSIHHLADRGIFVTTADYSVEAVNLARAHEIILIDGEDLVNIAALLMAQGGTRHTEPSPTEGGFKYCGECGERMSTSAYFCSTCGTKADS